MENMTSHGTSSGRTGGFRRGRPRYFTRRKVCSFCVNHVKHIDYKDVSTLKRFISEQCKIESRRKSGVCARHQRVLAAAIKRARHLALVPYSTANKGRGPDLAR